jgi:aryl-alcohol dehydrogenase-like predicted oxidoreductase
VPIPGTKRVQYLEENASSTEIELTKEELERIEATVPKGATSGERHPEMSLIGL